MTAFLDPTCTMPVSGYPHFFRPLTLRRRALIAACIRSFHERVYGSAADYRSILTREEIRDLFVQTIQALGMDAVPEPLGEDGGADFAPADLADEQKLASAFIRQLVADGWLETAEDRARLLTAYRFTRPGKIFAQALVAVDRPREKTRQRNMRSCKNALAAFIERRDVEDLLDAYEYAERVVADLSQDIELFYELARRILLDAQAGHAWDDFVEFVERRFRDEFSPRLVYDNVERHKLDIAALVERLRDAPAAETQAAGAELAQHAPWIAQAAPASSPLPWVLERIEEMVSAACRTKQPELFRAMESYVRRHVILLSQTLFMDTAGAAAGLTSLVRLVAAARDARQDALLAGLAPLLAPPAVALYDPATLRARESGERIRAQTVSIVPEITREERLRQHLHQAEARAFSLSQQDIVEALVGRMGPDGRLRLSDLPAGNAIEALTLLRAIEAARTSERLEVERCDDTPLENAVMSGTDYELRKTSFHE